MSGTEKDPIIERVVIFLWLFPIAVTRRDAWVWLLTGQRPWDTKEKEYGNYAS